MTTRRNKTVFHNTTQDLQDQDHSMQDQDQAYSYKINWNTAGYKKSVFDNFHNGD